MELTYDRRRCAGVLVPPGMFSDDYLCSLVIILLCYKLPYVEYGPLCVCQGILPTSQ
jgi:hypothetical protein